MKFYSFVHKFTNDILSIKKNKKKKKHLDVLVLDCVMAFLSPSSPSSALAKAPSSESDIFKVYLISSPDNFLNGLKKNTDLQFLTGCVNFLQENKSLLLRNLFFLNSYKLIVNCLHFAGKFFLREQHQHHTYSY